MYFAFLYALYAKAGFIGQRDKLFVEYCAADDGVFLAKHGTVQVYLGYYALCAGKMPQRAPPAAVTLIFASSMQPIMHSTP